MLRREGDEDCWRIRRPLEGLESPRDHAGDVQVQICRLPVRWSRRMPIVAIPEARSLNIIISLRFERSTRAPAIGLKINSGVTWKKPTKARVVALPVSW